MYTVNAQVINESGEEVCSISTPADESELIEPGRATPGMKAVAAVLLAATE